jgi:hypothetical protein
LNDNAKKCKSVNTKFYKLLAGTPTTAEVYKLLAGTPTTAEKLFLLKIYFALAVIATRRGGLAKQSVL